MSDGGRSRSEDLRYGSLTPNQTWTEKKKVVEKGGMGFLEEKQQGSSINKSHFLQFLVNE